LPKRAAVGEFSRITRLISPSNTSNYAGRLMDSLASSRIEGTQATFAEVLEADLYSDLAYKADVEDVLNYLTALEFEKNALEHGNISTQMILDTYTLLMKRRSGANKTSGHFRRTPVWIETKSGGLVNARFIPPVAKCIQELITDLMEFINSPVPWPLAAKKPARTASSKQFTRSWKAIAQKAEY
jgi:Fic family protein